MHAVTHQGVCERSEHTPCITHIIWVIRAIPTYRVYRFYDNYISDPSNENLTPLQVHVITEINPAL